MVNLEIQQVDFSYFNGLVVQDVSLSVKAGEFVGLIGPNGSGKTTLLKLASGILKPARGKIKLDGANLAKLNRKSIAHRIAVVPQHFDIAFAFTVADVVMLGRTPFLKPFTEETEADCRLVAEAMEKVGIDKLAYRRFDELSGGERQKVILAMAFAQQPKLLLLDEPTAHLDIAHQVEIIELVKSLNRTQGVTVVAAVHDLNLASLYFDRLVMLKDGKVWADGTPGEVLTEGNIAAVFSATVRIEPHPTTRAPHVVVIPTGGQSPTRGL